MTSPSFKHFNDSFPDELFDEMLKAKNELAELWNINESFTEEISFLTLEGPRSQLTSSISP
jgi:hypothetical protein